MHMMYSYKDVLKILKANKIGQVVTIFWKSYNCKTSSKITTYTIVQNPNTTNIYQLNTKSINLNRIISNKEISILNSIDILFNSTIKVEGYVMNTEERITLSIIKYMPIVINFIIVILIVYFLSIYNEIWLKLYYIYFIYCSIFIFFISLFFSFILSKHIEKILLNYKNKLLYDNEENKKKDLYIFQQSKAITISELMKNMSYQWKQHLSVISTISSGMRLKKETHINNEKEEIDFLRIIDINAKQLNKILDNLSDFYHLDSKKSVFSITYMINECLEIVYEQFKNHEIEFDKTIEEFLLSGDKNQLIQVILNILNKSRDMFLDNDICDRFIKIKTHESSTYYNICITHNAGLIEEEKLTNIFKPLSEIKYQPDNVEIELYMSYQIISKMFNGNILIKNTKVINNHNNNLYDGIIFQVQIPKIEVFTL